MIYNSFINAFLTQSINLTDPDFEYRVVLLSDEYTPDAADSSYDELSRAGFEIVGDNYIEGGERITFTSNTEENTLNFLGSRVGWTEATFSARYAIIYRISDGLLISCYDFGEEKTVDEGDFVINWDEINTISLTFNEEA